MNARNEEAARYYLERCSEFLGNGPFDHLLDALTPRIRPRTDGRLVVAVDVGCCVGGLIERLSGMCPEDGSVILGIEPNPLNFRQLEQRSFSRPVEFVEYALSDADGVGTLKTISDFPDNRPGYSLATLQGDGVAIAQVPVITFDQLIERLYLPEFVLRMVKIDTEGHDTRVIRGMRSSLDSLEYLVFESSDCLDDRRGPGEEAPLERIVEFLDACGFDTFKIGAQRLLKQNGDGCHECYERVKFHSNSFSVRKGDPLLQSLIDKDGYFR